MTLRLQNKRASARTTIRSEGPSVPEFDAERAELYAQALREYPDARREEVGLMKTHLAPQAGERIVGLGEGNGFFCQAISDSVGEQGHYMITDPSTYQLRRMLASHAKNVDVQVAGAQDFVAPPAAFDKAWSCGAFHHCPNQTEALKRVYRALRPGGRLVFVDVFSGTALARHFDIVVARYSMTGHEVKFLSDEFAVSACVLAGFDEQAVTVLDTPIHWYFASLRDLGRFMYALHGLTLLPYDEETLDYQRVVAGCERVLGVDRVGDEYALRWPLKTLIAQKN
jgi:arsenite methyltransferase